MSSRVGHSTSVCKIAVASAGVGSLVAHWDGRNDFGDRVVSVAFFRIICYTYAKFKVSKNYR